MRKLKAHLHQILSITMLIAMLASPVSVTVANADQYDTIAKELFNSIYTSFSNASTLLKNPIATASYNASTRSLSVDNKSFFIISEPDQEYTVENVGGPKDCYLVVSYIKYQASTAAEVRKNYQDQVNSQSDLAALPIHSCPVYLFSEDRSSTYYLTSKHNWLNGFTDGKHSSVLHIKEGEKVTFSLPDAQENDIYRLRIYAYSPDSPIIAFTSNTVLIDTDGVYPDIGANPKENVSFPTLDVLESRQIDTATAAYMPEFKLLSVLPLSNVYVASPEQTFTLTNTGVVSGYRISASVSIYKPMPADEIRQKYANNGSSPFLPTDDTVAYFCNDTDESHYYLTEGGVWASGTYQTSNDKVLFLQDGESVTFTLPDAKEDMLYQISVYTGSVTKIYAILVDGSVSVKETPEQAPVEKDNHANGGFTDVPPDAYYAESVAWAVKKRITTGTSETTFSPDTTCTNAQIITLLWRANASPAPRPSVENPFTDVTEYDFYYQAALWAHESGLVEGSSFNGSAPCTRAMTATYLWKLAGSPDAPDAGFTDVDSSAEYAKAVAWALREGITTGTGEATFSPDATCTRAQIVTLLYRALAN